MQGEKPFLRVLEFRDFASGAVFAVEGEIDLATVDQLTRALHGVWHRAEAVTIDLRRVSFIDCLGMRALLELSSEGAARGCRVEFIQGPRAVERLFELTGALQQLSFVDAASPPAAVTSTA